VGSGSSIEFWEFGIHCIGEQGRALSFKTPIHEIRVRSEPLINMLCEPLIRARTVQEIWHQRKGAHIIFESPKRRTPTSSQGHRFVADLDHWIWVTNFRSRGFERKGEALFHRFPKLQNPGRNLKVGTQFSAEGHVNCVEGGASLC
jgi:hypothetical protein